MSDTQTIIGRISARCGEEWEPARVRLRLSHLLGTVDFQPSGLPPRAILLIRRLHAPRPLALEGIRVSLEWEQALRGETSSLLQRAARPYRGTLPADAPAALFADEAELLACLGLLLVRPAPEVFWIWQAGAAPRTPIPNADDMTRLLCRSPRAVPYALELLAQWDTEVPFLAALPTSHVEAVFASVAFAFGLSVTCAELSFPDTDPLFGAQGMGQGETVNGQEEEEEAGAAGANSRLPRSSGQNREESRARQIPEPIGLPAWFSTLAQSGKQLAVPAKSLLLLTSAIQRAPTLAHAAQTLQALSRFAANHKQQTDANAPQQSETPTEDHSQSATTRDKSDIPAADGTSLAKTAPQTNKEGSAVENEAADALRHIPGGQENPDRTSIAAETSEIGPPSALSQPELWNGLEGIPTRLGGAFTLLNLFLRLDAPACFDTQFALSQHLTRWGLAQLLAWHLLGEASADFADDPLWTLLARLDNREPDEAVTPLPAMEAIASDLPDRTRTLQIVLESLQATLARALNDAPPIPLLRVPATVYVTRVHLDVVMSLEHIYLPARIAGLDATPGWIPELLRVVTFHFQ